MQIACKLYANDYLDKRKFPFPRADLHLHEEDKLDSEMDSFRGHKDSVSPNRVSQGGRNAWKVRILRHPKIHKIAQL